MALRIVSPSRSRGGVGRGFIGILRQRLTNADYGMEVGATGEDGGQREVFMLESGAIARCSNEI